MVSPAQNTPISTASAPPLPRLAVTRASDDEDLSEFRDLFTLPKSNLKIHCFANTIRWTQLLPPLLPSPVRTRSASVSDVVLQCQPGV
ncbi:hypothetical protein D9757_003510 [Collybiopsis confluens]|uniref:Uncharacterized protein n=1 Tax=Collybiopsis confluens TaxID=2823264 RepID=A0A8H5MCE6_9AGAR|nr:hypothetical protein D9757_003510 [Collybiopsis confluens]